MSPGRVECGPGMFSTAGATASRGVPGARRATVFAAARTVQAPALSIFISSIRSEGLMEMPPESKQTPLPTIARWRPSASFSPFPARADDDHPRRVVAAAADRHEHAHAHLGRTLVVDHVDPQVVLLGHCPGFLCEDLGRDVVRGTVREVAGLVGALADDLAAFCRAVRGHRHPRLRPRGSARRGSAVRARPSRGRSHGVRTSPRPCRGPRARRPPQPRPRLRRRAASARRRPGEPGDRRAGVPRKLRS